MYSMVLPGITVSREVSNVLSDHINDHMTLFKDSVSYDATMDRINCL